MEEDAQVRAALRVWRECLVDLTSTSRLLHLPPSRAGALEITDPLPDELLRRLTAGEPIPVEDGPVLRQLVKRAHQDYLDRGVEVLHVAAGLLHWRDEESAEHVSPHRLVPVRVRDGHLVATGEPMENPALRLRAADGTPEPVSLLACFTFHKEATYRDLLDNEDRIRRHPVVRALAATGPGEGGFGFTPIAAADIDRLAPPEDVPLVLDADATQRACIAAACAGRSFVMDGPPGTGKSQTIANMIACLLAAGKRVLFVSEKAAALDVVHHRLAGAGLGPFLLELHSHQAGRKEVSTALALACDRVPPPPAEVADDDRLRERREQLSGYAAAVNEVREPLGARLHDVLGVCAGLDGAPEAPAPVVDPATLTAVQMRRATDAAERLAGTWRVAHPGFAWRDVLDPAPLDPVIARAQHALGRLTVAVRRNAPLADTFGLRRPDRAAVLGALAAHAARRPAGVRDDWLTAPDLGPAQEAAHELDRSRAVARQAGEAVRERAGVPWTDLPAIDAVPAADPALTADAADNLARRYAEDADRWERHRADLDRITTALGVPPVETFADLDRVAALTALGGRAHRPEQFWFGDGVLAGVTAGASALRRCLESLVAVEMRARPYFADSILGQPVEQLAARFAEQHRGLRKLLGAYRRDRRAVAAFVLPAADPKEALARLGTAVAWQRARRDLAAAEQAYAMVLGRFWQGVATDFRALDEAVRVAAEALRLAPPAIRPAVARYVSQGGADPELLRLAAGAADDLSRWRPAERIDETIAWLRAQVEPMRSTGRIVRAFSAAVGRDHGRDLDLDEAGRLAGLRRRVAEAEQALATDAARLAPLLGAAPSGEALAWAAAARTLATGADRPLTAEQAEALAAARPDEALPGAAEAWDQARTSLRAAFGPSRHADWDDYDRAGRVLRELRADPTGPEDWFAHLAARETLAGLGLGAAADFCAEQRLDPAVVPGVLRAALLRAWADAVIRADPRLRPLHAAERDQLVAEFRRLDSRRVAAAPAEIIQRLDARRPPESAGTALLRREAMKTTGHLPVRDLLARARDTVLALKPCFLVSPLAVSQYLPPDLHFDVLIVDEASQVTPADAIAAVYRADALIVAGDDQQLPPASFFDHAPAATSSAGAAEATDVTDFPSILELAKACGAFRGLPLTWHYRSRHESLIAFANREFYRGGLTTFPSATGAGPDAGLELFPVRGVYRRSNGRDNVVEAQRVADRVVHHLATRPDRSLGVVTFSVAQAEAIERAVEQSIAAHPGLGDQHVDDRLAGFFVKSLESVQGDERDVMIFSIGYGFDDSGKISANFGPLNKPNGRRRLNVAITRARHRVEIVTSIRARDIPPSDNEGVRMLAAYLEYAERGATVPAPVEPAADRPFEESVRSVLESWGYPVRLGTGVDLAVPHPAAGNGAYAIGIQCDGAGYRAYPAARDRDRLRDQVLRGLGWHLHRVWSTAWYTDRATEEDRLHEAVAHAVALPLPGHEPLPLAEVR